MVRILIPAFGALLLLAGCDDGTPAQNVASVKTANTYSDQLAALSPLARNDGLWRALRDAGQRCKRVDAGAHQQDYKDMAYWTAHCTDTGEWMVFIAPNADVQIRPCSQAAELGLPTCKPLPAAERTAAPAPKKA
jgi:hypothetical protein